MRKEDFQSIGGYMEACMTDSAHDREHVRRVLYVALDIASHEDGVDSDVLIAACLLHDIGRPEQFADPRLDHAEVGAEKARRFLLASGFDGAFADRVGDCILTHRYRANRPPRSIEAKILFDADKIDATGTLGIARTIFYKGHKGQPLYSLRPDGQISDGDGDTDPSFFQEYRFKLEKLYDRFHTARARQLAEGRRASAVAFYQSMLAEVSDSRRLGQALLDSFME